MGVLSFAGGADAVSEALATGSFGMVRESWGLRDGTCSAGASEIGPERTAEGLFSFWATVGPSEIVISRAGARETGANRSIAALLSGRVIVSPSEIVTSPAGGLAAGATRRTVGLLSGCASGWASEIVTSPGSVVVVAESSELIHISSLSGVSAAAPGSVAGAVAGGSLTIRSVVVSAAETPAIAVQAIKARPKANAVAARARRGSVILWKRRSRPTMSDTPLVFVFPAELAAADSV